MAAQVADMVGVFRGSVVAAILRAVAQGESERVVAERFGVDQSTVNRTKSATDATASVAPGPPKVTGRDGKLRPATKPAPEELEQRQVRVAEAKASDEHH